MQKQSRTKNNASSQDQSPLEFFKVYIPSFSSHKLLMPVDFVKKYKGLIPNKALLKDPTGKSWNINIVEVGGDLFLTKGWRDFVHDKYLEFGDFLVFRFDRKSIFHVKIFGKNGCKKEGPRKARVKVEQNTVLEPTTSRPTCGFREEGTHIKLAPSRPTHGFREQESNVKHAPSRSTHGFREQESNVKHAPSRSTHGFREQESNVKHAPSRSTHGFREEDTDMEQAPSRPSRGFKGDGTNMEQTLGRFTSDFKAKDINMELAPSGPTHGFKEEETNIKKAPSGPIGVFREEDNNMKMVPSIPTHGFREESANMEQASSRPTRCCKRKFSNLNIKRIENLGSNQVSPAKSRKLVFQEENKENNVASLVAASVPHFVAPMSGCSTSRLHIPATPLKEFRFTLMKNMNLRDQNGKLWPISICNMRDGRVCSASGWRDFSKQNNLQMHDHCVFELVLGSGNVCGEMKVQIYRAGLVTQRFNKYLTLKM